MVDSNGTIMTTQQILSYHQQILDQALQEALRRNEEQYTIWTNYKARHKKVIDGLKEIPLEVGINCMVPIGKKALMKGRLVHTNEILVCLGEGYLVKYSAAKASDLCNRRIQWAEEMLKSLEVERNLYEMRQILPLQYDAFGGDNRCDLIEHWSEQDLNQWKISHREKEREYKQKLSMLNSQEEPKIESGDDDLFHRLDELEVEEELADELDRLEDVNSQDDEADYSEEGSSSSEEIATELIQKALLKQKEIRAAKDPIYAASLYYQNRLTEKDKNEIDTTDSSLEKGQRHSRRVSFVEPLLTKAEISKQEKKIVKGTVDGIKDTNDVKQSSDDDEPIILNITHSDVNPEVQFCEDRHIDTPWDIYKSHSAPKSILKKFTNEKLYVKNVEPPNESSTEEDDEIEGTRRSAYETVVKDIQENKLASPAKTTVDVQSAKRPISKFKMERRNMKK